MNKYLKYGLIASASLVTLVVALVVVVSLTFNPNDYKPQIVKLVQEKKQRTLTLAGDIKLSFFPKLGVDLGRASLSEHKGSKEFAAVESARFYLAWWPLLRKELVIDQVRVDGVRANLVRHADGSTNFDDLLKKEESAQFKFDIDGVRVSDSAVSFTDEKESRRFAISKLNLKTGRLTNGKPTDIEADFNLQGDKPAVNSNIQLTSDLMFDTDAKHYALTKLDLEIKGTALGITNLVFGMKGDVDADIAKNAYAANNLKATLRGKRGSDDLDFSLTAPSFQTGQGKSAAGKINATLKLSQPQGNLEATLEIPAISGSGKTIQIGKLALNVSGKRAGNAIQAKLEGSARADLEQQDIGLQLTGRLDDSTVQAKLGMKQFDAPSYTFDVAIDRFDLDRYFPPKKEDKTKPEQPLDFSALKKLNASGSLRIGSLKVANIKSSNVRLDIKASDDKLEVNPLSANLYQGTANGSLRVSAGASPQVAMRQNLNGVSVGPLLRDALNKDLVEGRGNVSLDVSAQGQTVSAMKKGLRGKAAINLKDGAVKGINIASTLRNAKAKLGALKGESVQTASASEQTDFSELSGSFNIHNGVAHNEDLSAKSPLLRLAGNGDIDIGRDSMNYLLKATVVGTLSGQGGKELAELKGVTIPVRVTGPFAALKYTLDFEGLAGSAVKQKVEEKKEEVKGRLQEELQKGLKGLFK